MSFLHPFSFPRRPDGTVNNRAMPIPPNSSHPSESYGSFAQYTPSPPRGLGDMDLNQSQFEEVVLDSQYSQNEYYDQTQSIHNDATFTSTESMTELHARAATLPRTCQPLESRDENMGNKRRRKASVESGTQAKSATGKFHWDPKSTLNLIQVKRAHDEARFHASVGGKAKTVEEQWVEIASKLAGRGTFVEWRVANDKWKRLSQIHKEIADWERNIPSGKSSYWQMSPRERKEEGKFGHLNFERDIFDAMERHFGRDPVVNPPPSLIDTTNSANARQHSKGSPTPASETGEECSNFEQTTSNSGVQKKTRKRTHMHDVGLMEATRDITATMGAAEDARNRRHQEVLGLNKEAIECNRDMVRIESEKVRMGFEFAAGIRSLSESLKEIAESLKK